VFFAYFTCFFVSPYFDHDAFMHHTTLVLDSPALRAVRNWLT